MTSVSQGHKKGRGGCDRRGAREGSILYEKSFNLKTISQGELGHFRENNQIILSKVAKLALKIVFKLKLFSYKIAGGTPLPRTIVDRPISSGRVFLRNTI
jgi:hypothetical protein